jgi:hypothetical protein
MDRARDQLLATARFAQNQHTGVGGGNLIDLQQKTLQWRAAPQNVAKKSALLHLLAQIVAFQLQFPPKSLYSLKGAGVRNGNRGGIRQHAEPFPAFIVRLGPAEHGQHAGHLATQADRVARKADQVFIAGPLGIPHPLAILRQTLNPYRRARGSNMRNLQIAPVHRNAVESTIRSRPISRGPYRRPGAGPQVQGITFGLAGRAAMRAIGIGLAKPQASESNIGLPGRGVNYPRKDGVQRTLLRDRQNDRGQGSELHGPSYREIS